MSEKSISKRVSISSKKMKEALQHCIDVYDFITYVIRQRAGNFINECDKNFLRELMEELHDIYYQMDEIEHAHMRCHLMSPITLIPDETEIIHPDELIIIDYLQNKKRGSPLPFYEF